MSMKVFELAKELGQKPLDLVEKLKNEGFSVRNHMNVLDDEQVDKARGLFVTEEPAPVKKKKKATKKKAAKKKTTKKKVSKLSTVKTAAERSTDEVEEEAAVKKASKKKKTVIRRKAGSKKAAKEAQPEPEEAAEVSAEEVISAKEKATEAEDIKSSDKVTASNKEEKPKLNDNGEKVHTFTPVFIPEKKEEGTPAAKKTAAEEAEDKKTAAAGGPAKKRLGDLAAIVAKPKSAGKSRDLTLIRAEEELKQYTTAAVPGQIVYAPVGKKRVFSGATKKTMITEVKDAKRILYIHNGCSAEDLATKLSTKFGKLRDKALSAGLLLKSEDYLGIGLCSKIAELYRYRVENKAFDESTVLVTDTQDENAEPRDPIITIMGHVDHGKTTLLDTIRDAKVADGEAGGITQHIGAYSVKVKKTNLTFLDTPGHAAFGAMRARGAQITDLVILVVAADDGAMPQTKESIKFCQEAGVPIIVAVNKMDKDGANPDRVKQELMEFNLTPEEWGGETQYIPISALNGDGIDDLLEAMQLQAEMMELKASPKGGAEGVVIESKLETGRGAVTTILIQKGTLKKGDYIVVGETYGRARSLMDYKGTQLKSAGPSTPVQILGLNAVPSPGDTLSIAKNEREAKKVIDNRVDEKRELEVTKMRRLEDFGKDENAKVLNLVIRSDVQGSYEAIKNALEALGNEEVAVNVIGGGVGAITDSDVTMCASAEGFIVGFNMRPVTSARRLAEEQGVDIKNYSIIYELINDVTLALEGMLEPEYIEQYIGRAEVRDTFSVPKIGTIAGSAVIDGKIKQGCNIRLLRQGKIVFDGKMSSLKRFKDDAKEVGNGLECGIALENFTDIKVDDVFEAYQLEEKKRKLEEVRL